MGNYDSHVNYISLFCWQHTVLCISCNLFSYSFSFFFFFFFLLSQAGLCTYPCFYSKLFCLFTIQIFFFFLRALPYGNSQARGSHQRYSCQLTPQLTAMPDPSPSEQGQGSNLQPYGYSSDLFPLHHNRNSPDTLLWKVILGSLYVSHLLLDHLLPCVMRNQRWGTGWVCHYSSF